MSQRDGRGLCSTSFHSLRSETPDNDIRLLKHEKNDVSIVGISNNKARSRNHCCHGISTMRFLCIVTDLHVFVMKNDVGNVRLSNNTTRSRNHCCHRISTMLFLSIVVDLNISVNNIKPLSFAMEMQGWVQFALFYW